MATIHEFFVFRVRSPPHKTKGLHIGGKSMILKLDENTEVEPGLENHVNSILGQTKLPYDFEDDLSRFIVSEDYVSEEHAR